MEWLKRNWHSVVVAAAAVTGAVCGVLAGEAGVVCRVVETVLGAVSGMGA